MSASRYKPTKLLSIHFLSRAIRSSNFFLRKMSSFANIPYSDDEKAEIKRWVSVLETFKNSGAEKRSELLQTLNNHLESRTFLLGTIPSEADLALYQSLAPVVSSWTAQERTGQNGRPHIVRLLDFVQNSALFGLSISEAEKVKIDPEEICYVKPLIDAKTVKERLKKEKETHSTSLTDRTKKDKADDTNSSTAGETFPKDMVKGSHVGVSKEKLQQQKKKEKAPKPQKLPAVAVPLSVSLIDLRVGHILKAIKHPEAETLYVSTIAMGDKPGTDETSEYEGQVVRTVCSGLNGLVPLEEMQGRKVVVVCNLKPVKMRGIKSAAMVLAASPRLLEGEEDHHSKTVELVMPPEGAQVGERVFFEGFKGEPEGVLNPKKKVWETFQPGFTTTDNLEVGFRAAAISAPGTEGSPSPETIAKLVTESGGVCKVTTLAGAIVR